MLPDSARGGTALTGLDCDTWAQLMSRTIVLDAPRPKARPLCAEMRERMRQQVEYSLLLRLQGSLEPCFAFRILAKGIGVPHPRAPRKKARVRRRGTFDALLFDVA